MKVTFTNAHGMRVILPFRSEEEGKNLKKRLEKEGIKDAKWEW